MWISVEDSVGDSRRISWSFPEAFVDTSVCEVTVGQLVQAGSGWPVLVSLTLRGGVVSEVSSDVELCWCWLTLGWVFILWVPAGLPVLSVSDTMPSKGRVTFWSLASVKSALEDVTLRV